MADNQEPKPQEEKEEKKPGLWASICLIFVAIAGNIEKAGLVETTNMFRMFFRSFLATIIVSGFGYLLYEIALTPETEDQKLNRFVGVILGYVAGLLTAAVAYYFGGQDRSNKPEPKPENMGGENIEK